MVYKIATSNNCLIEIKDTLINRKIQIDAPKNAEEKQKMSNIIKKECTHAHRQKNGVGTKQKQASAKPIALST